MARDNHPRDFRQMRGSSSMQSTRRKPIIGITPSPMEDTQSHGSFTRYAMATTYTEAVEAAGGVPLVIPPQAGNIDEIFRSSMACC